MQRRNVLAWVVMVGLAGGQPARGAYWLDDAASIYNTVNPSSQSQDLQQDTGEQSVAGPLALSAVASGTGNGGAASSASLNADADYGVLSVQLVGSAANSSLSGAAGGVANDSSTPAASFGDQLTLISGILPTGYPVVVQIAEAMNANMTSFPMARSGSYSAMVDVSATMQAVDITDSNLQTLTIALGAGQENIGQLETMPVLAHIGDQIQLTGMLYVRALASVNLLSPLEAADFNAQVTVQTGVSISLAFPSLPVESSPAEDVGLVGYVADSGTIYPTDVPEPNAAALAGLGGIATFLSRKRSENRGS